MKKLQKKNLLVEIGNAPFFVRHEATENHNEVTVAVVKFALPVANITNILTPDTIQRIQKIGCGFPGTGLVFNFKREAPAFLFTCKGKTERRGDDVHNQELADRIALAKCRAKAYTISKRVVDAMGKSLEMELAHITEVSNFFDSHAKKESSYVAEGKYLNSNK